MENCVQHVIYIECAVIATGGKLAQKQTERKMPGGSNLRPPTLAVGGQILTIELSL